MTTPPQENGPARLPNRFWILWSAYLLNRLALTTPASFGAVLSLNAVTIIVLQPLASRLLARFPRRKVLVCASLLMGAGFGATAMAHDAVGYAALVAVWSLAEVMLVPTSAAHMSDHAPDGRTGTYQGAYSFAWNSGLAVGSPAGQMLYSTAGAAVLWPVTFALGAAAALAHWHLGKHLERRPSRSPEPARREMDSAASH